ncbi:MAG TPA: IS4 family transposase [Luteolibacter sp.]
MHFEIPAASEADLWAHQEFAALACSDARRKRRFLRVASDFLRNPTASVPAACGDWAGTKACYRLFDHEEIRADSILEAHRAALLARLDASQSTQPLLFIQDTTALNFGTRESLEGLGSIGTVGATKVPGIFVHGHLVVDTLGEVHGLAGADIYTRQERPSDAPAGQRNRLPLEQKESQRWIDGWQEAQKLWEQLGGKRPVLVVADREADIYEFLATCQQTRAHRGGGAGLLIRSKHDRKLADGSGSLWQTQMALPLHSALEVELPRGKQGLQARTAVLEVRAGRVRLAVPHDKKRYFGMSESLELWALEVIERQPPAGVEAVRWRLLTTEAISNKEDARRLAGWYALRWRIEVMHRILKTGCRVEGRQARTVEKLKAFIALDLVVAVRLLGLIWQARVNPQGSCASWLERDEWEALSIHGSGGGPAPDQAPDNQQAVRMIAKLGGFLGRKGDGDPGPEVLWRGLAKLRTLTEAWILFRSGRCG